MPSPLVSIITLSYNYARYIEQAIRSVLDQTYPHWELVIVDDGSQDDSLSVIRRFDDPRIVVLPLPSRHGACRAYNIAYAQCRGTYLGTVDADDLYLPEKLERQVALLEARPDLDVVGTWIVQIDADGREVDGVNAAAVNQPRDLDALDSWVPGDLLTHSSALIRKSTHDRVGGLNPQLHLAPDFELWLRFLAHGGRFTMIPERLTGYRSHPANVSHTHDRRELWLELCFLFAAHLAPMLVRRGRQDLFAPALSGLAATIADAGIGLRTLVFRRLAQFPLLPRDYETFRARLLSEIRVAARGGVGAVGAGGGTRCELATKSGASRQAGVCAPLDRRRLLPRSRHRVSSRRVQLVPRASRLRGLFHESGFRPCVARLRGRLPAPGRPGAAPRIRSARPTARCSTACS